MATSTPLKILTFHEETKKLQKEFDLQEALTNIGIQRIIDSIEEQYIEELNKTSVMPTTQSKVFSTISKPSGARS